MARDAPSLGAQIFEIGKPDNARKVDALATRLRGVLGDREDVRISRPSQTSEIRVRNLDDSIVSADVVKAVASAGGCPLNDIKVGDTDPSAGD